MKLRKRLLSTVLALAIINTSGCTLNKVKEEPETNNNEENSKVVTLTLTDYEENNNQELEEVNEMEKELEVSKLVLSRELCNKTIKNYLALDYEERQDENLKSEYIKALYMCLLSKEVPIDTYLKELNNLIILQINPSCLPNNLWNEYFKELIKIADEFEADSLYDMFIDLAYYTHDLTCDFDHTINDDGTIFCDYLDNQYNLIMKRH